MPDDRLFHKRLGHSEKTNSLTDFEYIVWQAYVLSADDFGVLRFSAVSLQADHDRLARKTLKVVQRALQQVADIHLLETFEHQGRTYGFQGDWQDWQHVDFPRATINPCPPADSLDRCTLLTRKLFERHPGGWRKKAPRAEDAPNDSAHSRDAHPESFDTPATEITREPLAVSRKPLAVSHQPLAMTPPPRPEARSNRIVANTSRFVVFDWQFDDLRQLLGPHLDAFCLDEWFQACSDRIDREQLIIAKGDIAAWLYAETVTEAERRGLRITKAPPKSNGFSDGLDASKMAAGLRTAREQGAFNDRRR